MDRRTFHKLAGLGALGALSGTTELHGQSAQHKAQGHALPRPGFRQPAPIDFEDHSGFVQIFDGKNLQHWDGNPDVWRVENGAIVGISTSEKPAGNTFIVYHGTEAKDFDLKLEIKVEYGGGSGVQYRSATGMPPPGGTGYRGRPGGPLAPPARARWTLKGPQADFWYPVNEMASSYTGQLYSQNTGRGIIAWRGQVVNTLPGKMPRLVGNIGDRTALGKYVKTGDWN
ncbi:MAG: 3-keto-disaccharide hydrolase, partial [Acidobacteriaceae bacterium]